MPIQKNSEVTQESSTGVTRGGTTEHAVEITACEDALAFNELCVEISCTCGYSIIRESFSFTDIAMRHLEHTGKFI